MLDGLKTIGAYTLHGFAVGTGAGLTLGKFDGTNACTFSLPFAKYVPFASQPEVNQESCLLVPSVVLGVVGGTLGLVAGTVHVVARSLFFRSSSENPSLDALKQEAEDFVKNLDYDRAFQTKEEMQEYILSYMNSILDDPKFQSNPQKYVSEWIEKRGYTEELRIPEDIALQFFRRELDGVPKSDYQHCENFRYRLTHRKPLKVDTIPYHLRKELLAECEQKLKDARIEKRSPDVFSGCGTAAMYWILRYEEAVKALQQSLS